MVLVINITRTSFVRCASCYDCYSVESYCRTTVHRYVYETGVLEFVWTSVTNCVRTKNPFKTRTKVRPHGVMPNPYYSLIKSILREGSYAAERT
jgi:hypothetical protein